VSVSIGQLNMFKLTFFVLTTAAVIWIVLAGALVFALPAFKSHGQRPKTVADGTIYLAGFALTLVLNVAIIFPGLMLLQPGRLWYVMRLYKRSVTPRQRFRCEGVAFFSSCLIGYLTTLLSNSLIPTNL
jgi:hypothetical protein